MQLWGLKQNPTRKGKKEKKEKKRKEKKRKITMLFLGWQFSPVEFCLQSGV